MFPERERDKERMQETKREREPTEEEKRLFPGLVGLVPRGDAAETGSVVRLCSGSIKASY